MAKCPKCGATLKDDQGIVTCQACGAIMLIDMDGVPQVSGEAEDEPRYDADASVHDRNTHHEPSDQHDGDPAGHAFEPPHDFGGQAAGEANSDAGTDGGYLDGQRDEPIVYDNNLIQFYDEPAVESGAAPAPNDHQSGHQSGHASDSMHQPALAEGEMLSVDDPLGLNSFANSELSSAKDGMLMCRIYIAGVDTKEIRGALRASMNDARFNWNPAEILSRLKKGQLVIEDVTPVKATILINRIKQLPLRIRWDQYTIAQAENEPVEPPSQES